MAILDRMARLGSLVGIVGVSLGATVLAMCSRTTPESRSPPPPEPRTRPHIAADAGIRDATSAKAKPLDARAARRSPQDAGRRRKPDAKLWDVICE